MKDQDYQPGVDDLPEDAAQNAARSAAEALDAERIAELIALARDESVELPVGAEEFARALASVAGERDELLSRLQRTAADFQNYQRRAVQNERDARELAKAGVVQSVINVVDYFDLALKQNPATATVDQVLGGVRMIKSELLRVLGQHGVGVIEPGPGAAFDPLRHEAIEQVPAGDVRAGDIVACRAAGYTLGDRVVRSARVVVAREGVDANV